MKRLKVGNKLFRSISKPYLPWIIIDSLINLMNAAIAMVIPWIIEEFFWGNRIKLDLEFWSVYLSLGVFLWIAKMVSGYILRMKSMRMIRKFRTKLFGNILYYPLGFFSDKTSSQLTSCIMDDSSTLKEYIFEDFPDMIVNIITMLACTYFIFNIDPLTAAVMLLGIPVSLLLLLPIRRRLYANSRKQKRLNSEMREYLTDTIDEIKLIKISGTENMEIKRGKSKFRAEVRAVKHERIIQAILNPLFKIIGVGLFISVGGFAIKRIIDGKIGIGEAISFGLYFAAIIAEVLGIIVAFMGRQKVKASVGRITNVCDGSMERLENGRELTAIDNLEFNNVAFKYDKNDVFTNLNFKINKGESVALVGASGSGKSTILRIDYQRLLMSIILLSLKTAQYWRKAGIMNY